MLFLVLNKIIVFPQTWYILVGKPSDVSVVCRGCSTREINMSPCVPVPEEVDVFKVPHLRMKELVNDYFVMVCMECLFVLT